MIKIFKFLKNFVGLDGVLHFLACAVIVFTFFPILDNIGNAVIVATVVAITKEYFELYFEFLIEKFKTFKQSLKDILFDALGVGYAVLFLIYLY